MVDVYRMFPEQRLSRAQGLITCAQLTPTGPQCFLFLFNYFNFILGCAAKVLRLCKIYGRNRDRVCVCVYLSVASHISETSEAFAITFDTVTYYYLSHVNASRIIVLDLE